MAFSEAHAQACCDYSSVTVNVEIRYRRYKAEETTERYAICMPRGIKKQK